VRHARSRASRSLWSLSAEKPPAGAPFGQARGAPPGGLSTAAASRVCKFSALSSTDQPWIDFTDILNDADGGCWGTLQEIECKPCPADCGIVQFAII
jgi:hypothetical protein